MGDLKNNQIIDCWQLRTFLGAGGNGEVWESVHVEKKTINAVKFLKTRKAEAEPIKRFEAEIEIHKHIDHLPGILPMIEYYLPNPIPKKSKAWLAMPVAIVISKKIEQKAPLNVVVEAIASFAGTLSILANNKIHHRDIKPGNLFYLNNKWVIGDFGLVDFPEKEAITENNRKLGPLYYLAPEMLSDPKNADGEKADVYSLIKTLWVLASGQQYPLPGEQRADVDALTLSAYVQHDKAVLLDQLIERATQHSPEKRPTLAEITIELNTWLKPLNEPEAIEILTDISKRIKARSTHQVRNHERYLDQVKQVRELCSKFSSELGPLAEQMKKEGLPISNPNINGTIVNLFKYHPKDDEPKILTSYGMCMVLSNPGSSVALWSGIGIDLLDNRHINIMAAHKAYSPKLGDEIIWHERMVNIPLGSSQQEYILSNMARGISDNLKKALMRFEELL